LFLAIDQFDESNITPLILAGKTYQRLWQKEMRREMPSGREAFFPRKFSQRHVKQSPIISGE
jgi:hypothetical protein